MIKLRLTQNVLAILSVVLEKFRDRKTKFQKRVDELSHVESVRRLGQTLDCLVRETPYQSCGIGPVRRQVFYFQFLRIALAIRSRPVLHEIQFTAQAPQNALQSVVDILVVLAYALDVRPPGYY